MLLPLVLAKQVVALCTQGFAVECGATRVWRMRLHRHVCDIHTGRARIGTILRGRQGRGGIHVELIELSAKVNGVGGHYLLNVREDACLLNVEIQVKIAGIKLERFLEAWD